MAKKKLDGNVTVLGFGTVEGAEIMLENVNTWEEKGLVKVLDACVVTRGPGSEVQIKQTRKFAGKYSLGGGGIGFLAGMLIGGPVGGLIVGATVGAISGAMKDYGIEDKFIRQVADGLAPNSSALFLMTTEGKPELMDELEAHQAVVMSTTVAPDVERRLRDALSPE